MRSGKSQNKQRFLKDYFKKIILVEGISQIFEVHFSGSLPTCRKVWLSSCSVTSPCESWQRSSIQYFRRVDKYESIIFSRLWTQVDEISENCWRAIVVFSAVPELSIVCSVTIIFAIESRNHRKKSKSKQFLPQCFREGRLQHFYSSLLASITGPTV